MSISALINLDFAERLDCKINATNIIKCLINNGWRINCNHKISYIPLGDNGMYNWQEKELSYADFYEIIKQKEIANEDIGVDIYWKNTEIGLSLLIFSDLKVTLILSINRVKIDLQDIDITDSSWYLQRIIPYLYKDKMVVVRYTFIQD